MEKKKGFTIIEVALVLAIAGLIFMMVFIALPPLRRSQRDTTRRDDVATFLSELKKYQTNNRGALPEATINPGQAIIVVRGDEQNAGNKTAWGQFFLSDFPDSFIDPSGYDYTLAVVNCGTKEDKACTDENVELKKVYSDPFPNNARMVVVLKATCNGNEAYGISNPRKVAVLYRLEGASTYCMNS